MNLVSKNCSPALSLNFLKKLHQLHIRYHNLSPSLTAKLIITHSKPTPILFKQKNYHSSIRFYPLFSFSSSKQAKQNKSKDNLNQEQTRLKKQQIRKIKIKQIQQEQLNDISQRVNLTKGNYNSFVEYLRLYKSQIGVSFLILLPLYFLLKAILMGSIEEIEEMEEKSAKKKNQKQQNEGLREIENENKGEQKIIKKKKKICLVSRKYEEQILADHLTSMFLSFYTQIKKEDISFILKKRIKLIQQNISHLHETKHPYQMIPISSQQPIILPLPGKKILISKSILRSSNFSDSELTFLTSLAQQLFNQRSHILDLSPIQIPTFWNIKDTANEIKLRQIYSTPYKRRQILRNIELLIQKQKRKSNFYTQNDVKLIFEKLKKLSDEKKSGQRDLIMENLYRRLKKYYIFVKIE